MKAIFPSGVTSTARGMESIFSSVDNGRFSGSINQAKLIFFSLRYFFRFAAIRLGIHADDFDALRC